MTDNKVERRGVSMYPEQWQVVEETSDHYGFNNVSLALRFIVGEFNRSKNSNEPTPENQGV